MSSKYKIYDQAMLYFVTYATVGWVDLFTRDDNRGIILQSLAYCHHAMGLDIYA